MRLISNLCVLRKSVANPDITIDSVSGPCMA